MKKYTQLFMCCLLLIGLASEVQAQKVTRPRLQPKTINLNQIFGRCGCENCGGRLEHNDPYDEEENAFFIVNRWSATVLSGGGLGQGDATMITWSIVPDGTDANGNPGFVPSNLIAAFDNLFNEPNAGSPDLTNRFWHGLIQQALDRWGEVSGIEYVYEPNDDGATNFGVGGALGVRGDVRIGGFNIDGGGNVLAFNTFPNSGDMAIDTADSFTYGNAAFNYRLFRNVFTHEQGHGIGFAHLQSNNAAFLMEPFISGAFDGPQIDDVLAAQRQYGDIYEKENGFQGNDTVANASDLGTIEDGENVVIGTDGATGTVVGINDVDFVSIDDNNDTDYFKFTIPELSFVDVVLTPVGATYNQSPEGGPGNVPINQSARSNLTLTLLDSGGSPIQISNTAPTGSPESIMDEFLLPGEYLVRATGNANTVQLYTLSIAVEGLTVPTPTAPSVVSYSSGATLNGTVAELLNSDNQDLNIIPTLDGLPDDEPIVANFTFFSPDVLLTSLSVTYEASANSQI